jgi:hypothetical protein
VGKGNPIKEILKAPKKLIGEITGQSDLLKAQKKQEEAQKKQLEKEEAEAKALEAKQKSDEEFNRKSAQEIATLEQNRKNSALNNLESAGMDEVQTDFSKSAINSILKDKDEEDDLLSSFRRYGR